MFRSKLLLAGALSATFAGAAWGQEIVSPIFETGFEVGDFYRVGDLDGQNGWGVYPRGATAFVAWEEVFAGRQAVGVEDGQSFGAAQREVGVFGLGPVLASEFAMYADRSWAAIPDGLFDRFEAQQRLVFLDGSRREWTLEFGLLTTSVRYEGLMPGEMAYYIEVSADGRPISSAYQVVANREGMNAWHLYRLVLDLDDGEASLYVDGDFAVSARVTRDLTTLSMLELQNQRWGTGMGDNAPVYFDELVLGPVGCAPDLNGDGVLDVLDFVMFQNLWTRHDPRGDCDGDGRFSVLDFVCFSRDFQMGCEF